MTHADRAAEPGRISTTRNMNVEAIRVLAMVWLVLYHAVLLNDRPGLFTTVLRGAGRMGWLGTDVFLVIAGFYCVRLAARRPGGPRSDSGSLPVRAMRLIPPYALFLAAYLTAGVALQRQLGNDFRLDPSHLVHFFTFTTNLRLAAGVHTGVALEGLFALAIGVQLYLGITLMLRLVSDPSRRIGILVGMLVVAIVMRAVYSDRTPWFIYFHTFTRMDAFVVGALLGVLEDIEPARRLLMKRKRSLLIAGAGLFVATAGLTGGMSLWLPRSHQLIYPAVSLATAALLNFAIRSAAGRLVRRVGSLGRYSYGVYLTKLPVTYIIFRVCEERLAAMSHAGFTVVFVISTLIGCYATGALWFLVIERPFIRLSGMLSGRRPAAVRARA